MTSTGSLKLTGELYIGDHVSVGWVVWCSRPEREARGRLRQTIGWAHGNLHG